MISSTNHLKIKSKGIVILFLFVSSCFKAEVSKSTQSVAGALAMDAISDQNYADTNTVDIGSKSSLSNSTPSNAGSILGSITNLNTQTENSNIYFGKNITNSAITSGQNKTVSSLANQVSNQFAGKSNLVCPNHLTLTNWDACWVYESQANVDFNGDGIIDSTHKIYRIFTPEQWLDFAKHCNVGDSSSCGAWLNIENEMDFSSLDGVDTADTTVGNGMLDVDPVHKMASTYDLASSEDVAYLAISGNPGSINGNKIFHGIVNGNGYTFSNLTLINNSHSNAYIGGLFGQVYNAKIQNIIVNINIKLGPNLPHGVSSDSLCLGGFIGYSLGALTIDNVENSGIIDGGITTLNAQNAASGGLVGCVLESGQVSITNSGNIGNVFSIIAAGGLVGEFSNGGAASLTHMISNVSNNANISGVGDDGYSGGIVGMISSDNSVSILTASQIGSQNSNQIGLSTVGGAGAGGIVGSIAAKNFTLTDAHVNKTQIFGGKYSGGGLVGLDLADHTVISLSSVQDGSIGLNASRNNSNIGGLEGTVGKSSSIQDCFVSGAIGGLGSGNKIGGFFGAVFGNFNIQDSYFAGPFENIPAGSNVGGFVGDATNSSGSCTIIRSFITADMSAINGVDAFTGGGSSAVNFSKVLAPNSQNYGQAPAGSQYISAAKFLDINFLASLGYDLNHVWGFPYPGSSATGAIFPTTYPLIRSNVEGRLQN